MNEWLINRKGRGWYRPNAQGYTDNPDDAGRYSKAYVDAYSNPDGLIGSLEGITIMHESELPDGREASGEAVAWMHTLHMELGQQQVRLTRFPGSPFGESGKDYSAGYSVTSEPLYLHPYNKNKGE